MFETTVTNIPYHNFVSLFCLEKFGLLAMPDRKKEERKKRITIFAIPHKRKDCSSRSNQVVNQTWFDTSLASIYCKNLVLLNEFIKVELPP